MSRHKLVRCQWFFKGLRCPETVMVLKCEYGQLPKKHFCYVHEIRNDAIEARRARDRALRLAGTRVVVSKDGGAPVAGPGVLSGALVPVPGRT